MTFEYITFTFIITIIWIFFATLILLFQVLTRFTPEQRDCYQERWPWIEWPFFLFLNIGKFNLQTFFYIFIFHHWCLGQKGPFCTISQPQGHKIRRDALIIFWWTIPRNFIKEQTRSLVSTQPIKKLFNCCIYFTLIMKL